MFPPRLATTPAISLKTPGLFSQITFNAVLMITSEMETAEKVTSSSYLYSTGKL
jgi:hypothetical protein